MIEKKIKTRIQQKHDIEVNWLKAAAFIPMKGEIVVYDNEIDANGNILTTSDGSLALPSDRTIPYTYERFKIGDGITSIIDLPFAVNYKDNNTTYTLAKNGSIIKLIGSDGSETSVTDSNTKYDPAGTAFGLVKSGGDVVIENGIIHTNLNVKNGVGDGTLITKTGDNPEVDYNNYAQHDAAVALGDNNRADGRKSIALGTSNNVTSYIPLIDKLSYADAVAHGKIYYLAEDKSQYIIVDSQLDEETYNSIEKVYEYIRAQANSSIAVGQVNTVYGNCGGAFGSTNTLDINGGNSYAFGKNNYLNSYRSFIAGENNRGENGKYHQFILGNDNIALGDKEILLGTGLKSSAIYQTTVGKFNEDKPNALFVVGAGGSDGARRNILEVEHHLANLNGTLNINDHFNVGGNSTLKGNLSVRANPNDKNVESFYVNQYGAYDIGGKLSNASNLNNGDAACSLVAVHVSNTKANKATGVGSLVGGSANFWQAENNSVSGANSIGWGYKTTVTADHSYGLGWGISIKNSTRKLAYGIYNEDKANTVFEIGKGNNDLDRKNIFEITDTGIARAYGTPIDDVDLVRLNELRPLLKLINGLSEAQINALNTFAKNLTVEE